MPRPDSDRNLLFGMLALQMDFLTRDALIAGMNAWLLEKGRPLGDLLVERGDLDPLDRALLDPMVDRHVARHGGDPLASLAALSSLGEVADDLRRSVAADPDLFASLDSVPGTRAEDPFATRAASPHDLPSSPVRFRKVREHAAGNLGVVYVARDEELNREVALKEIKEKNADHVHSQAKFLLEAEVTGGLEHPGIVPVYGLGHHLDGRPFYAMRFIRGRSLLEAIKRFHADESLNKDPGRRLLALQKLLRRFTDVCNAVAYAHSRGILHRDLKPDNVMVGQYGETLVVDWGLAKALGSSGEATETNADHDDPLAEASLQPSTADQMEATYAGALVGTPAYMSPEQAAGRLDLLSPASDIYGLGATLYHLITGRPPIEAKTLGDLLARIQAGEIPRPRSGAPWLDKALEAICLKAMALKPERRYSSARALAEDLDRWIAGEPVAAYPEPWARRARRWRLRNRTAIAIATTALIVFLSLNVAVEIKYLLLYLSLGSHGSDDIVDGPFGSNQVAELEATAARLPAILKQEATPRDAGERLILANLCYKAGRLASAARLAGEAFAENPTLVANPSPYRYNAACIATMAGTGQGKDDPAPDETGRARLRDQALGWLQADLTAWAKVFEGANELARKQEVAETLAHWKEDLDLAGIRDEASLAKLPEGERVAFRSLWADVEELRKKAAGAGIRP